MAQFNLRWPPLCRGPHLRRLPVVVVGAAVAVCAAVDSQAQPIEIAVQGRLTSVGGGAVADGTYPLAVAVYDAPQNGNPLFKEFFLAVPTQGGVFSLALGAAGVPLDGDLFTSAKLLHVGVTVGGEPELPRQPLRRVPTAVHALHASEAADVQCSGCVGADDIAKGAVTSDKIAAAAVQASHVAFAWAAADAPGGAATLAWAANTAKQAETAAYASFADEAAKAKESLTALTAAQAKDAQNALTAALATDVQCTGCIGVADVAGSLPADWVKAGKLAAVATSGLYQDLVGGPDLSGYAALDAANTFTKAQTLTAGLLAVSNSEPAACDAKTTGLLYFDTQLGKLRLCLPGGYRNVMIESGLGSELSPAQTCQDLLAKVPSTPSGLYWINPSGNAKFQAWCDMTTDGGGWTLIEAFDIVNKGPYAKAPFATVDLPRNQDTHNWDDYRLGKARTDALIGLAKRFHARCHRDYASSQADFLFANIDLLKGNYGGYNTQSTGANPHNLLAKVRNYPGTQFNFLWWNIDSGNSWHAGFDVSGTLPNSTPSEDSFAWHDGGTNPNHLCHNSNGEIVWMLR